MKDSFPMLTTLFRYNYSWCPPDHQDWTEQSVPVGRSWRMVQHLYSYEPKQKLAMAFSLYAFQVT